MSIESKGPSGTARLMAADILADWQNEVVIIQEKSKEGIQLVQPQVFLIPMDDFMKTACALMTQRIDRERAQKAEAAKLGLLGGGRPPRRGD